MCSWSTCLWTSYKSLDGSKNVPVGKIIALIAEDGDDISNLEVPKEDPSEAAAPKQESQPETPEKGASAATPSDIERQQPPKQNSHEIHIKHSNPLFPSVQRLLTENGLENADAIKGTGIRGMLTKGDVLAYLGKVSTPLGSYKPLKSIFPESKKPIEEQKVGFLVLSSKRVNIESDFSLWTAWLSAA